MPSECAVLLLATVIHCSIPVPLMFRADITNQPWNSLVDCILRFRDTVLQVIPHNVLVFIIGAISFVSSTIYWQNAFMNLNLFLKINYSTYNCIVIIVLAKHSTM